MEICFTDTETRARVPISHGNDLYTRDAECRIVTYAIDEAKSQIWQPWEAPRIPSDLEDAICDERVKFVAHNAPFDYKIYLRSLKIRIPLKRWRCTQAQAYSAGLPGSLEILGKVLGLPLDYQKLTDDKYLIHVFCEPSKLTNQFIEPWERPDEWARFCNYAIRDTDALREIYRRLPKHNYSGVNLEWWVLNQLENERGFGFDAPFAREAVDFLALAKKQTNKVMHDNSGGAVGAATQRKRLLEFLQRKHGLEIANLTASEVRDWLEHDDLHPEVRILLETRLEASKSAGSKYNRGLTLLGPGDRMRNTIQWSGAGRTGRNSGRGFQPHNMARPQINVMRTFGLKIGRMVMVNVKAKFIDDVIMPGIRNKAALNSDLIYGGPNEAAALALRHVIIATAGNNLQVVDWKNIESRITPWIAGEEWVLEAYRAADRGEGDDLYKLLFHQFFGIPISEIDDVMRQCGKVCKLAFDYGGGVGALVTMSATYQMDLDPLPDMVLPRATPEQLSKANKAWRRAFLEGDDYALERRVYMACDILKQVYRESHPRIDQLKHDFGSAALNAIRYPGVQNAKRVGKCTIWATENMLIIELPSGRRLLFMQPRLHAVLYVDPDTGAASTREYWSYCAARGKSWRREDSWPGLTVENVVQAIANDVLRQAAVAIHKDTFQYPAVVEYLATLPEFARTALVLDVHDELVLDLPPGAYPMKRFEEKATEGFGWSVGLPLAVDGWTGPRYGKR